MRISDWSSDVCSSDLIFPTISIRKHRNRVQSLQDKLVGARKKHLGYGPGKGKKGGAVGNSVDERIKRIMQGSPMLGADEIGRASCRARVCRSRWSPDP